MKPEDDPIQVEFVNILKDADIDTEIAKEALENKKFKTTKCGAYLYFKRNKTDPYLRVSFGSPDPAYSQAVKAEDCEELAELFAQFAVLLKE